MATFIKRKRTILFEHDSSFADNHWVWTKLKTNDHVTISRCFTFKRKDLLVEPDETDEEEMTDFVFRFRFGVKDGDYYRIKGRIFGIKNKIYIAADDGPPLVRKTFVAERNVSIFRRISKATDEGQDIIIGGKKDGAVPLSDFEVLLTKFPNTYELDRYANARVADVIGEYLDSMKDARELYEAYMSKNRSILGDSKLDHDELNDIEIAKYTLIRDTIQQWLTNGSQKSEADWQKMILQFVLLLFPKYIAVFEKVRIADSYSTPGKKRHREIDLLLVDASGNVDVIEIKRPRDFQLLSKGRYRENYTPSRELAGSIMQAEKYIFHLTKWGVAGEKRLTKRYEDELPNDLPIRITNPKALIILGRDGASSSAAALDHKQLFDLEVIKRKYANMMDIITYDDLLRRLDNIISSLYKRKV